MNGPHLLWNVGLALGLCGLGACAGASSASAPRAMMASLPESVLVAEAVFYIAADSNGDRVVASSEWGETIAAEWEALLGDGDAVRRAEIQNWVNDHFGGVDVGSQFGTMAFDPNFDGVTEEREFRLEMIRRFEGRDENGNGSIERSELFVRLPQPTMMRPPAAPRGMPPGGMPPGGRPPGS